MRYVKLQLPSKSKMEEKDGKIFYLCTIIVLNKMNKIEFREKKAPSSGALRVKLLRIRSFRSS